LSNLLSTDIARDVVERTKSVLHKIIRTSKRRAGSFSDSAPKADVDVD
jgi:hypothetical protein